MGTGGGLHGTIPWGCPYDGDGVQVPAAWDW